MGDSIIQQVVQLEQEADRLVEAAGERAAELEGTVEDKIASMRQEREKKLEQEVRSHRTKLEEETEQQLRQIDQKAQAVSQHLDSLAPETRSRAVDLVRRKLRGE